MRYTVLLEPTAEADHPGWYYARIPALDLTTHGFGVEGALEAARDLVDAWLGALAEQGTPAPPDRATFVSHIEATGHAVHSG